MSRKISVMLVEDNPEYREVIRLALEDRTDMELSSQFGTSEIALRSLRVPKGKYRPDIILLDLRLPGMDGIESISGFREAAANAKIIILTQSDDETDVLRAITLGASGYLLKSSSLDQITQGIIMVHGGGATLDPSVAMLILAKLQQKPSARETQPNLTDRELEILNLLAEGLSKKEIATRLEIGYSTVDTHVAHIYGKLDVTSAPAAVDQGYHHGLLRSRSNDQRN